MEIRVTNNRKIKVGKVGQAVLLALVAGGVLAVMSVIPALLVGFISLARSQNRQFYMKSALTRLKEQGFVEFFERGGKKHLRLTDKGRARAFLYKSGKDTIKKPWRWDGKWRVVIFDIKETRRLARTLFRKQLQNLGFVRVQNSVWAYPYECDEVVAFLKSDASLGRSVLCMTVEQLESDKWLREKFDLA